MNYNKLIKSIESIHLAFFKQAVNAVNINLTLRNWFIGYHIVEFEQKGADRAEYGTKLLESIAESISIKGLSKTNLKLCRQFYNVYPEIYSILPEDVLSRLPLSIRQSATDLLQLTNSETNIIGQSPTDQFELTQKGYIVNLIKTTSFTHFVELVSIDDPVKRKFYELLIIKTTPSVKELKRQINTLAFERVGLSENTPVAISKLQTKISPVESSDIVKSHYFLEFLNYNAPELIEESELEQALIAHIQSFILELGNGFCFEARQKRILIGEKYYFIDMIFYNRILKCHVLIELKVNEFESTHASQLNTYLNFYKKNIMEGSDNPPVGILLVANKNNALVEYATAGMDSNLFVSKYLLQLPDKKQFEEFLNNELKKL